MSEVCCWLFGADRNCGFVTLEASTDLIPSHSESKNDAIFLVQ